MLEIEGVKLLSCNKGAVGSVKVPDFITEICSEAFSNCTGIENIVIPDSVKIIGPWAFNNCTKLKEIRIPDLITEIATGTFENCSNLTDVSFPDSLTKIGTYAFRGCHNLVSICIPETVVDFGEGGAFHFCEKLEKIYYPNLELLESTLDHDVKVVTPNDYPDVEDDWMLTKEDLDAE